MIPRSLELLVASAVVALLGLPLASDAAPAPVRGRAAAAVTLGSTDGALIECGSIAVLMGGTATGGPSWTSPIDGVVTSWKYGAGANGGSVRLMVVRPSTTTPGAYDVVAKAASQPVATGVFNTFASRVPIVAGQQLAMDVDPAGPTMPCVNPGSGGDSAVIQGGFDSSSSNVIVPNTGQAGVRMDLSAVVEPDADHDGFGDVSQDVCPGSAATQAACPAPDTTITKAPKKKSTQRKATVAFSSDQPGSTFTCAVDGKAAVTCTSPFRTKVRPGRHTVVVTALSALGIPDPTPATVRWKVRKRP